MDDEFLDLREYNPMPKVEDNAGHIPVMYAEILDLLKDQLSVEGARYFDGTFGRGGHLRKFFSVHSNLKATAFDQDLEAIEFAKTAFASELSSGALTLKNLNFAEFNSEEDGLFNGMLIDLGVSSPQLDQAHRGFSFYHNGPLDMRMNTQTSTTAADLLHNLDDRELIDLFQQKGEIQRPHRVVRAVVNDRKTQKFENTKQFADMIARIDGWHKKGQHPATKYFMALRLEVNQELEVLQDSLEKLILGLKPQGRLLVLTFHSLEDRIVKNRFRDLVELGRPVFKKVLIPSDEEQKQNPRSRSAKLRVFERN